MENDKRFESVYSSKVRAGRRRTYFFDVRKTKGDDFYVTLTESTKKFDDSGYERHKLFLYKEDFNRFVTGLQETINHVKTELMPDYDYEQFERRQEEWDKQKAEEEAAALAAGPVEETTEAASATEETTEASATEETGSTETKEESDEDISW